MPRDAPSLRAPAGGRPYERTESTTVPVASLSTSNGLRVGQPLQAEVVDAEDLVAGAQPTVPGGRPFAEHSLHVDGQVAVLTAAAPHDAEAEAGGAPLQGDGLELAGAAPEGKGKRKITENCNDSFL
ncbi:hypothetical protein CDAR_215121 [Caerostris darwini]|uniref:Uncharacterized protein n=1 Tax=Caerostris darwini TaxID=1538125 RepID=A0AAV4QNX3_9ARAC|nr:hypothetical protein CDAR_215121 [Caerostris darwini]